MTIETEQTSGITAEWNPLKPRPNVDVDNAEFWEGLRRSELLLWTCRTCGAAYWPKCYCIAHENEPFAANMSWKPSSGLGRIYSMNRHHTAFNPGFAEEIPYTLALIELDEGPLISSTIVGDQPEDLRSIGLRVRVVYKHYPAEGFSLPHFELIDE